MKVRIEVAVTSDRLSARVVGRDIAYEAPNRVALSTVKGRELMAAIGDDADDMPGARQVEGVAVEAFDPNIAAGVVSYLGILMWDRLHPDWRGPLGLLDNVEVRVSIERYDAVSARLRRALMKALPYYPGVTWWVEGEKVSN